MLLKRIYKPQAEKDPKVPVLSHIELRHTGTHAEQNFSRRLVEAAVKEGWMKIEGDKLALLAKPENLVYTIKRTPGRYDNPKAPAGYEVTNAYECVLDAAQHAKFRRVIPGRKGE